ncbi:MAG TPA: hypothetical protein PKM88_15700, partial [bacterium]|nr:hypothetical protein [bacterium]
LACGGDAAMRWEAVAAAGEGREAAIPLRAVADRVLNAAAQALDRMETPSPAPDTAPANAASPAVAPTVAPVPFAPLAAKPAAARFVAEPYVPSAAMPVIAVPGLTTALPVPAEPPLVDRFLERRCAALVGCEVPPLRTNMLLAALARQSGATQCGALHVTCTDEAEAEARERFARSGVGLMLPPLAGGRGAVMQICNRGGCYEPGILAVAAEHYAAASRPLTLVVRVQAHCGVIRDGDTRGFGTLSRYGCLSPACGVLQAVLGGDTAAARGGELARSIDQQQLAAVRATDVRWRALCMAVLQARTQLEQATTEARALARPAWHVLLGAVNLNGLREAMELPVIIRIIDRTGERERGWELALPHDPGAWQLAELPDGLRLTPAVSRTNNGA